MSPGSLLTILSGLICVFIVFYSRGNDFLAVIDIRPSPDHHHQRLLVAVKDDTASSVRYDEIKETLRIGLQRDGNGGYVGTSLSDMAYLDHCNFQALNHDEFVQFDGKMTQRALHTWTSLKWNSERIRLAHQEFTLELLEIYAQAHGMCNFQNYKPTVPTDVVDANTLQRLNTSVAYDSNIYARLVIVIVAYKDVEHLFQLVEAVVLPQHVVVIHLERTRDTTFEREVRIRAQAYDNVIILKFGSILYKTDLITTVNLRIMRFLTLDLHLPYDYLVTLDGAAYPLYSANDLSQALKRSNRHVFLGELKHFGQPVSNMEWAYNNVLHRFTLTHTFQSNAAEKGYQPLQVTRQEAKLSVGDVKYFVKSKTNSGNTAVYSYDTVHKLLTSSTALKIHSFHKYGCCHYPEETEWYAMLNSIFGGLEALQVGSMYQVWEETRNRRGRKAISTSNAVLTSNKDSVYILADAYRRQAGNIYYNGTETKAYLEEAKRSGFLFCRKFDSSNDESVDLREWIQRELHRNKRSPFLKS